jgi:putative transposase
MCRVLKVSASGYYAWRDRAPSPRRLANAVLIERIGEIHRDSGESYGMPRVRAELLEQGHRASRKRVARLMRLASIRGISRRRGFVVTTQRDPRQRPAPDLVNRKFVANGPNQIWVADMTYVATWTGFVYLAVVLDSASFGPHSIGLARDLLGQDRVRLGTDMPILDVSRVV